MSVLSGITSKFFKHGYVVFVICVFSLLPFKVNSADHDNFKINPKVYVGVSAGLASMDTGVDAVTGTATLDESDLGLKGLIGANVNEWFAVEGFYANFGTASLTGNNGDTFIANGTTFTFSANNVNIELEGSTFGFGGVVMLPIHETIVPFGRIGMHYWDMSVTATSSAGNATLTDDGFDPFLGGGIQFNITENIALRAEYELFKFDDENVELVTGGLIFRF
jgi:OOP family OmpA-OmpF porin